MKESTAPDFQDDDFPPPCGMRAQIAIERYCQPQTADQLRAEILSGRARKWRDVGPHTLNELRRICGLPEEPIAPKKGPWKFDPWTGEPLAGK